MKHLNTMQALPLWLAIIIVAGICFSCGGRQNERLRAEADSLNALSYHLRYKNHDSACHLAQNAYNISAEKSSQRAEALNNLGFCAFIRMDFEQAENFFQQVYDDAPGNDLECLVADVGMMKICQRTAMNKEFYDYRNSALRRMRRINDDRASITSPPLLRRFHYAQTEFSIASAVYYYYLQQEQQSIEAIDEVIDDEQLQADTAQWLYYAYMRGSGGMYSAATPEEVVLGEFGYLMECLAVSRMHGYIYFEANALQAMAELLRHRKNYELLLERRAVAMRAVNADDLPWEELVIHQASEALRLFQQYGDVYQISSTYRTLASCCNVLGRHEEALNYLCQALEYVNRHHEKYYHCNDTTDRLRPFVPQEQRSIELKWIDDDGIKTVPEWIARFREQLSVTYAALGMKQQSDYNRNIYLDLLDYTRQDKELESRYNALQRETDQLNGLLSLVIIGIVVLIVLFYIFNRRWHRRNAFYISKQVLTLDICRKATASVPTDAASLDDVARAVVHAIRDDMMQLFAAEDFQIKINNDNDEDEDRLSPEEESALLAGSDVASLQEEPSLQDEPSPQSDDEESPIEPTPQNECCHNFPLRATESDKPLGEMLLYKKGAMKKEDCALMEIITPYVSWTLENGLTFISLGDEQKRLEKEQYVHEKHLDENKRQNLVKRACLSIVSGIMPFVDRIVNEVKKINDHRYENLPETKKEKYRYIGELVNCINEYNDILALWIKMRQGSLSLHIENFELNPLFEVIEKSRHAFEMKKQKLIVEPTDAVIKADKALTMFMINTLTENARKYTQKGGKIMLFAREEDDFVQISVADNGPGLTYEDVQYILDEKYYITSIIGLDTAPDVAELKKNKGHGFGLMNCKGIIEKYRKTDPIFRVCQFRIETEPGQGCHFFFRLPKGNLRKTFMLWLLLGLSTLTGCGIGERSIPISEATHADTIQLHDPWLEQANSYAYAVYQSNVEGYYPQALAYADSALSCLNSHYEKYADSPAPLLTLEGEGAAAELTWYDRHFFTDYYALLDVRNEAAVAFLALGQLEAYRYNNTAYTALYKQISQDSSLEAYCRQMQLSANDKMVAIILCVLLVVVLLAGYYFLYLRHRLMFRYNLEQVMETNRLVMSLPISEDQTDDDIADFLVQNLYESVNELIGIEALGLELYNEDTAQLSYGFFSPAQVDSKEFSQALEHCFIHDETLWPDEGHIRCLPLLVKTGEQTHHVGALAVKTLSPVARQADRLLLEMVASYVAIVAYNAVVLVSRKVRDIESAQDEARRVSYEENQLHVQNMVLDNCLSTIKHETVYYPNKIKKIIERYQSSYDSDDEDMEMKSVGNFIGFYKDILTILTSCAARQLDEVTFRRTTVRAKDLATHASRYLQRAARRLPNKITLKVEAEDVSMLGDVILLKFMLENLIDEALSFAADGELLLWIRADGDFVRFDFIDPRRCYSLEELKQLFFPRLSRIKQRGEGVLTGTEFLICKQIIRDHDEFGGRRGCRINADHAADKGYTVWFTIPARI